MFYNLQVMFHRISMDDISLHSGVPKQFSRFKNKKFNEWEIPPWELYIDSNKLLGEGSWAKVYLAEWRQTTVVAKVLKNTFDIHAKELIIKELINMTKMHHPNIVQLFGYVEEPFVIVMEYFQNGDLYDNFHKLKLKQKVNIASDIIKGLIYLHERRPNNLIHRDIKLRNILLTNSYTAKIADFGLSTFSIEKIIKIASNNNLLDLQSLQNLESDNENNYKQLNNSYQSTINNQLFSKINDDLNNTSNGNLNERTDYPEGTEYPKRIEYPEYTNDVGTVRYMAPEIKTGNYNNKVDIYSCGILLYELFSNNIYEKEYDMKVILGLNLKNANNIKDELKELILRMTNIEPTIRPTASSVLCTFQQIYKNYFNVSNNFGISNNKKNKFFKRFLTVKIINKKKKY